MDPVNVLAKFEVRIAIPVPEIIGGTQKNCAVPGYAHAPFLDPANVLAKFEVRRFTRSWDNRGYLKINLYSPWIHPRSLFSKIINGLLFGSTL